MNKKYMLQDEKYDVIKEDVTEIKKDIKQLIIDVAGLKVKSSVWGAIAGFSASVPFITGLVIYLVTKK